MFLLLQLPYCVSVLLLTSRCKSAPAQCKCRYYLAPPLCLLRKQIYTKLILCKPLFIVDIRVKGFLKVIYTMVQKQGTSVATVDVAHA